MDAIRADVQQRVFAAARRWIDVDSAITEEEALARLLKGKAGYATPGSTSIGSHEHSRVSLPDSVVDAPSLATMLPAQAKQCLEEFASRMLLPPQEAALIRASAAATAAGLWEVRAASAFDRPSHFDTEA
jgi:hypothetical protein